MRADPESNMPDGPAGPARGRIPTEPAAGNRPVPGGNPPEEGTWAFLGFIWRRKWIVVVVVLAKKGSSYDMDEE